MNGSDPKQTARELLEEAHPALIGLSHWIHANPEMGFEETLASGWVAEWLTSAGFDVATGVAGMPTAVVGSTGPGPLHVAICAEYDALPGVGHACGHNIVAAAGVGAGVALAAVAEELGLRVTVMGTPAEEGGGGKIRLIDNGSFHGVHAAMMVHPWPADVLEPSLIAARTLEITCVGREAHAAGFPHLGINAADALVVAQTAIGLLRQHLLPTDRVHGIVTKGGDAPNVVPGHTTAQFMTRAASRERLDELTRLVRRCFEAGALATGAEVAIEEQVTYADMRHDVDLAAIYRANAESLGRVFDDGASMPVSTDMGDVSYLVPSIHPMIGIDAQGAVNHQPGFAAACVTPSADQAIMDGALAMAWTVIDAAQDVAVRSRLMGQATVTDPSRFAVEADQLESVADAVVAEAGEAQAPAQEADAIVEAAIELQPEAAAAVVEAEASAAIAEPEAAAAVVEAEASAEPEAPFEWGAPSVTWVEPEAVALPDAAAEAPAEPEAPFEWGAPSVTWVEPEAVAEPNAPEAVAEAVAAETGSSVDTGAVETSRYAAEAAASAFAAPAEVDDWDAWGGFGGNAVASSETPADVPGEAAAGADEALAAASALPAGTDTEPEPEADLRSSPWDGAFHTATTHDAWADAFASLVGPSDPAQVTPADPPSPNLVDWAPDAPATDQPITAGDFEWIAPEPEAATGELEHAWSGNVESFAGRERAD